MNCRHCGTRVNELFIDLGFAPLSNAYVKSENLQNPEMWCPLKTFFCRNCLLVQTLDVKLPEEIFDNEYAYFSSVSSTWVKHCKVFSDKVINDFKINKDSFVIEIACNDGCLIKNFSERGIPCLGIEPTSSTAETARREGVEVEETFFNEETAYKILDKYKHPNLIVANNVLAHVSEINSFVKGLKVLMEKGGIASLEFPHFAELLKFNQFDTIYHEHFSYFSLSSALKIFSMFGLRIFKVTKLKTHGGSLRIFVCNDESKTQTCNSVALILKEELECGVNDIKTFEKFRSSVARIKTDLLDFLLDCRRNTKRVAGYGAAAKGNTLLNFCGVKNDLISKVFDAAESKQGKYLPGSHILIEPPKAIIDEKPDFIIILPWNLKQEIFEELKYVREWGCKFVTFIPSIEIF